MGFVSFFLMNLSRYAYTSWTVTMVGPMAAAEAVVAAVLVVIVLCLDLASSKTGCCFPRAQYQRFAEKKVLPEGSIPESRTGGRPRSA
jgi:hypothetical protein